MFFTLELFLKLLHDLSATNFCITCFCKVVYVLGTYAKLYFEMLCLSGIDLVVLVYSIS